MLSLGSDLPQTTSRLMHCQWRSVVWRRPGKKLENLWKLCVHRLKNLTSKKSRVLSPQNAALRNAPVRVGPPRPFIRHWVMRTRHFLKEIQGCDGRNRFIKWWQNNHAFMINSLIIKTLFLKRGYKIAILVQPITSTDITPLTSRHFAYLLQIILNTCVYWLYDNNVSFSQLTSNF